MYTHFSEKINFFFLYYGSQKMLSQHTCTIYLFSFSVGLCAINEQHEQYSIPSYLSRSIRKYLTPCKSMNEKVHTMRYESNCII